MRGVTSGWRSELGATSEASGENALAVVTGSAFAPTLILMPPVPLSHDLSMFFSTRSSGIDR